jgi:hypothetical protein
MKYKMSRTPLVVGHLVSSGARQYEWPEEYSFVETRLPKAAREDLQRAQTWLKKQYSALMKQKKLRKFAPHILPYGALVDITLSDTDLSQDQILAQRLKGINTAFTRSLSASISSDPLVVGLPNHVQRSKRQSLTAAGHAPLQELDLITNAFYPLLSEQHRDISNWVHSLEYDEKIKHFETALPIFLQPNNRTLSLEVELITEPHTIEQLVEHGLIAHRTTQLLTPELGYELPNFDHDGDIFQRSFDISLELYLKIAKADEVTAQLVCLYGHRQRYSVTLYGAQIKSLFEYQQKQLRSMVGDLQDLVKTHFPLTAQYLQK